MVTSAAKYRHEYVLLLYWTIIINQIHTIKYKYTYIQFKFNIYNLKQVNPKAGRAGYPIMSPFFTHSKEGGGNTLQGSYHFANTDGYNRNSDSDSKTRYNRRLLSN